MDIKKISDELTAVINKQGIDAGCEVLNSIFRKAYKSSNAEKGKCWTNIRIVKEKSEIEKEKSDKEE